MLLSESPAHGWDLCHRMRELGTHADPGNVYRNLRVLEAAGCVGSDWQPSAIGPDRRTYHVTDAGRRELEQHAAELAERRQMLNRFLMHHQRLAAAA